MWKPRSIRASHELCGHIEKMWKYMIIVLNITREIHEPRSHMEMMWKRCENVIIILQYITRETH